MTIRQKFISSIVIFNITLLILGISVLFGYQYVTRKASLANDFDKEAMYLHMMLRGLNEVIIHKGNPDSIRVHKEGMDGFEAIHSRLIETIETPEVRKILTEHIDPEWKTIKQDIETFFDHSINLDNDQAMLHVIRLINKTENILKDLNDLSYQTRDIINVNSEKSSQIEKLIVLIALVLLVTVSTLVYRSTYKSVLGRIHELNAVAEGLTNGNLNIKMDESKEDEFALLAMHFNKFTEQLQTEIIERNRAEQDLIEYSERLERNNVELQEFAFVASHDLQEPLRKILAFSGRLKSKFDDRLDDQGRDYLERIQKSAERMKNLIEGLLSLSRLTTRAIPFEQVDLKKAAEAVVADLDVSIEKSGGRVEISDMTTIDGDPLQIQQVLQNLILNALKFTKKDTAPEVKVYGDFDTARKDNGNEYYAIVVEDNGIGFDEKYTDRIFGVFQRLHGNSQYDGTGMGLSICRKIIDRHHGDILAKSSPGEGSSFIVTLPVKQEESSMV